MKLNMDEFGTITRDQGDQLLCGFCNDEISGGYSEYRFEAIRRVFDTEDGALPVVVGPHVRWASCGSCTPPFSDGRIADLVYGAIERRRSNGDHYRHMDQDAFRAETAGWYLALRSAVIECQWRWKR